MASIRTVARSVLGEARDGIGWIAVWREGRSWHGWAFFPEDVDRNGVPRWSEEDMEQIAEIVKADKNAIMVNAWWHNLGDTTDMTADSLAHALRWQYDEIAANLITNYTFFRKGD